MLTPRMVATVSAKNNNGERYYYAFLTEERSVGDESKRTPQHITLIPPFIADKKDVIEVAAQTALEYDPFNIEAGERAMFGPEKDIPVIIIKPNELLHAIHMALLKKLEDRNIAIQPNRFIGDGFIPHIALKPYHPDLDETRPITVDHIAVMHKYKSVKTVLAKNVLGKTR